MEYIFNPKQSKSQETWGAVGGGLYPPAPPGVVQSMHVFNGELYLGGWFSIFSNFSGGVRIVKWNGVQLDTLAFLLCILTLCIATNK